MNQMILWGILVIPWFLLLLLDKQRVKRFFTVGLFAALMMTIAYQVAEKMHWWTVQENVFFLTSMGATIYCLHIVITIFVFYLTYPGFILYIIVNIILDLIHGYVIVPFLAKIGLYNLYDISHFGLFLVMTTVAIILYLFQRLLDFIFEESPA
ncbi:hypothetical protein ABFY59_13325 [Priestia aryabhattai]|uniref:hypothetical protein n=1 Tax=Priestia aryabhattai TaxID=412384 RepID=UPI003D291441